MPDACEIVWNSSTSWNDSQFTYKTDVAVWKKICIYFTKFTKRTLWIPVKKIIELFYCNRRCMTWYSNSWVLPIHTFPASGGVRSTTTPSLHSLISGRTCVHFSWTITVCTAWIHTIYRCPCSSSPGLNFTLINSFSEEKKICQSKVSLFRGFKPRF